MQQTAQLCSSCSITTDTHQQTLGCPDHPSLIHHCVAATQQALLKGEWQRAYAYLSDLPSWNLLAEKDRVLGMIQQQLKEEGLRTYLLTYGAFYHSLSHQHLSETFDLPDKKVGKLFFWVSSPPAFWALLEAEKMVMSSQGMIACSAI